MKLTIKKLYPLNIENHKYSENHMHIYIKRLEVYLRTGCFINMLNSRRIPNYRVVNDYSWRNFSKIKHVTQK